MSQQQKAYIAGIGMITPVGFDTTSTAAAVKAGISAYQETDYLDDDCNPIRMALVPDLLLNECLNGALLKGDMSARAIRMLQLSTAAIVQLIPFISKDENIPLFLAGPEQLDNENPIISKEFIENIALQTGINIDVSMSRTIAQCRAGSLSMIDLAFRYFQATGQESVLIGGVDSFYDHAPLNKLAKEQRLSSDENSNGFIPGEAAGFILFKNSNSIDKGQHKKFVYLPGSGIESGHLYSNDAYKGEGLSTAINKAIGNSEVEKINRIYSSMNGESFFAKEYGVAVIRNKCALDESTIMHPADCYGDIGAASGMVMLGIGATDLDSEFPSIVYCSSDHEQRFAVVLDRER